MPGSPWSVNRHASNRLAPKPVRRIDFRNCFGMMASVSTFARSSGATIPVWTRNGSMALLRLGLVRRLLDGVAGGLDVPAHAFDGVAAGGHEREARERQQRDVLLHARSPAQASRRTSTKCPVIAAAAAIAGLTKC